MIAAVAVFASLLADAFMFATLAELLASGYDEPHPHAFGAWTFCIVALAGYALPRLVEGFDIGFRKGYAVTSVAGALLIYLFIRIETASDVAVWDFSWIADFLNDAGDTTEAGGQALAGGIFLLATWARSTLRSADEVEMETIPRSFTLPFAIVTVAIVLGAMGDRSGEVGRAGAAFYFLAILSLASSQLALSGATFGELRASGTAGVLLAGTLAVGVVALLIIGLATTILSPVVGPVLSAIVVWSLTIVLTPFAWLLERFFDLLFAGSNPFAQLTENVVNTSRDAGETEQADPSSASRAGAFILRMLALALFLGAVSLFITIFVRLRKRREGIFAHVNASAPSGDFRGDLGSFFRSLLRRGDARLPGVATTEATRLYLEVLRKAEEEGHAREGGETAREFAPELHEAFATPVTDEITQAFEAARYGGREPDERTIQELRQRWVREAR